MRKAYEEFHGHPVRWKKNIEFHPPEGLVVLGKAVAVEYETDKLHGGGDGRTAVYRHTFETPCFLCMDERQRKQLYIIGNRIKVTEAGVEN